MLLEEIQSLYEQEKYNEVIDACIQVMDSGVTPPEVFLFTAKAVMQTLEYNYYESALNIYVEKMQEFFESVTADKEVIADYVAELQSIMEQKKIEYTKACLEELCRRVDNYHYAMETWKATYTGWFLIDAKAKSSTYDKGFEKINQDADQMSKEEYDELIENSKYNTHYIANEDICQECYNTALKMFSNAKASVESLRTQYLANTKDICASNLSKFTYIELLLSRAEKSENVNFRLQALKKDAEIRDFSLNATYKEIGGSVFSLRGGDRTTHISELKKIYNDIAAIDSNFIIPELPSTVGYKYIPKAPVQSSDGCYVATAVYGSYNCPEVWTLRRFRDGILSKTWYGRAFIHTYYAISPTLVKLFGENLWFYNVCKPKLDKLVTKLNKQGVENSPYQDKNWRL